MNRRKLFKFLGALPLLAIAPQISQSDIDLDLLDRWIRNVEKIKKRYQRHRLTYRIMAKHIRKNGLYGSGPRWSKEAIDKFLGGDEANA